MQDWQIDALDDAVPMIDPDEPELIEALWRWLLMPAAVVAGAVVGLAIWQAAAPERVRRPMVSMAPPAVQLPAAQPTNRPRSATQPAAAVVTLAPAGATRPAARAAAPAVIRRADFGAVRPAPAVRRLADWAVDADDARGLPFAIVDKQQARVWVFEPGGRLAGQAPILLGYARGDFSVPGIGARPLNQVKPGERTTPAGRFVAEHGRNLKGEDIVWVDYDAAVSMHRVRATNPAEMRLQRLASPTAADNRISYGCINLPAAFYERVLARTFAGPRAIVYVLPETLPAASVFRQSYDVDARARQLARMTQPATQLARLSPSR